MKQATSSSQHPPVAELRRPRGRFHGGGISLLTDPRVIAALRQETVIPGDGMVSELQKNPLISSSIRTTQSWSRIVYGEEGVLDEKIKKILESPSEGYNILHEILTSPQSIHKFAGASVCGFKNKVRRNAVENLNALCDAMHGLIETVEYARGRATFEILPSYYEQPMRGGEVVESLLESFNNFPRNDEDTLTNDELVVMLKKNPFMRRCVEDIQYWCTRIYGNPKILNRAIAVILEDPERGRLIVNIVATDPNVFGSLVGTNVCGIKNKERREAEDNVGNLYNSVYFFLTIVRSAKELITEEFLSRYTQIDQAQDQIPTAVAQDISSTRTERPPTPQQERPRSARMAFAL